MEPLLELSESINWDLAYRNSFSAPVNSDGEPSGIAISPVVITIPTHSCVVICLNQNAPNSWFLGAWVSVRSPRIYLGSTASLNEEVELFRDKIPLRTPKFIQIPNLAIPPYNLYVKFPYWHTAMLLEAWFFNNPRSSDPTVEALKEINEKVS